MKRLVSQADSAELWSAQVYVAEVPSLLAIASGTRVCLGVCGATLTAGAVGAGSILVGFTKSGASRPVAGLYCVVIEVSM